MPTSNERKMLSCNEALKELTIKVIKQLEIISVIEEILMNCSHLMLYMINNNNNINLGPTQKSET